MRPKAADNSKKGCSLETRERCLQDQTRLLESLRSLPDSEALQLLQQLRQTSNTSRLVSSLEGGLQVATRPSDLDTARAMLPATQSSIEFELMTQYGTAYPRLQASPIAELMNILPTAKNLVAVGLPGAPDNSLVPMHTGKLESRPESRTQSSTADSGPAGNKQPTRTAGPRPPPQYCDSRLERLQIRYWTKVPISNELAARLISFYLETDHAVMGFFDADLFLDDLLQASVFKAALFQEAEILWNGESSSDSIFGVVAIEIFSNACLFEGKVALGMELATAGRCMAERMGLVGSVDGAAAADIARRSPQWAKAVAHAAWGALFVVFSHQPAIKYPPRLPIPGEADDEQKRLSETSQGTSYIRIKVFAERCKLSTITQEIMGAYIAAGAMAGGKAVSDCVPLAFAEAKYRKLLDWAASLPADMERAVLASSDLVVLHVIFHVIIITIFRPFTSIPSTERLKSFSSTDSHPKQIYAASVNQLCDLIGHYRANYPVDSFSCFIGPGLFTLGLALLEDRTEPMWRFYFLLCLQCWRDLYVCYPLFRNVAQTFLSIAVQKNAFTSTEAKELMEYIDNYGRHHAKGAEALTTFFFDLSAGAVSEFHIDAMARKLDDMILFDEFTTGAME
ncbi:hypothetical protein CSUB01_09347 [Colletotrichum sublineola]|uniref:Uncharacterized protein n=1 Tax=Colletotrichum sublineola TaxID=1173701 RepID=A0A066X3L6_COLSU|nr:hypothetical protein CSUB01_09347 [Colletotrichum sublineola]